MVLRRGKLRKGNKMIDVLWTIYLSISLGAFIATVILGSNGDNHPIFFKGVEGREVVSMMIIAFFWPLILANSLCLGNWFETK